MSVKEENSTLSQNAKKRIFVDTKDVLKDPLTDMGIYYQNDEENLSLGYALIIGPPDTPYHHGYYLFEFQFPHNYPFDPPKVTYMTNDGITRFNPNLYTSGKVCLSLLNTWTGPSWRPCQTLRSVLLSILSNVFVDNPFLNEPGMDIQSCENAPYNEIVRFKNIEFACLSLYLGTARIHSKAYDVFLPTIKTHFQENRETIGSYIVKSRETFDTNKESLKQNLRYSETNGVCLGPYKMSIRINYDNVNSIFGNTANDTTT